jgi:hypothetical protein
MLLIQNRQLLQNGALTPSPAGKAPMASQDQNYRLSTQYIFHHHHHRARRLETSTRIPSKTRARRGVTVSVP